MARNYSFYICPFWQSAEEYMKTISDGNKVCSSILSKESLVRIGYSQHFVRKDEILSSVTFK